MRLFYVDDSGDPHHHFYAGLLVDGPQVAKAEAALDSICEEARLKGFVPAEPELHAMDLFHCQGQWERATIPQAIGVFDEALAVIPELGIEVIARGVHLESFRKRYGALEPYRWEFSNLLERLNERLGALDALGLVIADEQKEYGWLLRRDLRIGKQFGTDGYRRQKLIRVLDTVHFVDSGASRMIQLADLAVFVLRRRGSIPRENDDRLEEVMSRWHKVVYGCVPENQGQFHTIRRS